MDQQPSSSSSKKGRKKRGKAAHQSDSEEEVEAEGTETKLRDESDDHLVMEEETVANTFDPIPFPNGRWDVTIYNGLIRIRVVNQSADGMDLDFDLVNVEAPIANALRRILIAEVPTMAIEKIYLYQNTSCIQDEVLSHRLGLIPIRADPTKFDFPAPTPAAQKPMNTDNVEQEPVGDPARDLIFELHVVCPSGGKEAKGKRRKERGLKGMASDGEEEGEAGGGGAFCVKEPGESHNWVLYTGAFKWVPVGEQRKQFTGTKAPRMVHKDIVLAKMRAGQEIEARCHCVKGVGRDHAKFSPVATASYRMLPQIRLKRHDFDEDQAQRLQSSFSQGVIGRDARTGRVYVKDARADTSSRNIFRHEDLKDAVEMGKKKTHFIFSVESTGAMPAARLVEEACAVMKEKVEALRRQIQGRLAFLC